MSAPKVRESRWVRFLVSAVESSSVWIWKPGYLPSTASPRPTICAAPEAEVGGLGADVVDRDRLAAPSP